MKRKCQICSREKEAKEYDFKRGWSRYFSSKYNGWVFFCSKHKPEEICEWIDKNGKRENLNFASQLFSNEKSDIISVKRKIQYSLYFPKWVQPPTTSLLALTSLNYNIKRNLTPFFQAGRDLTK